MSEDPLFNLETDPLVLDEAMETEPPAPPVVVVQYRNRGVPPVLLFPTTLILSLGMFAAYHYLFVAPRQRELREEARAAALAASSKPDPSEADGPAEPAAKSPDLGGTVLSLDSQPLPPSPLAPPVPKDVDATRVAAKPVADAPDSEESIWDELNGESEKTSVAKAETPTPTPPPVVVEPPKEAAPPPAIGFARPSDAPRIEPSGELALGPPPSAPVDVAEPPAAPAAPVEVPTPTAEEMQRSLEAEAEAKRLEREEQERTREEARVQVENEAQARVDGERSLFRDELKRIVAAGGSSASQEIDELCDKYGRTYSGEIKAQVLGYLSRHHGKVTRDVEVRLLRSLGVPEAGILDYLANGIHPSLNSRNGPRSPDEVRVRAAQQLLRTKLLVNPAVGGGSPTRARQTPTGRSAVARPAR